MAAQWPWQVGRDVRARARDQAQRAAAAVRARAPLRDRRLPRGRAGAGVVLHRWRGARLARGARPADADRACGRGCGSTPSRTSRDWLTFHLKHVHYNFEYLGANWNAPRFPWHVALVTTLFTVPVATLAAAALGTGRLARARAPRRRRSRARAGPAARAVGRRLDRAVLPRHHADLRRREALDAGAALAVHRGRRRRGVGRARARSSPSRRWRRLPARWRAPVIGAIAGDRDRRRRGRDPDRAAVRADLVQRARRRGAGRRRPRHEPPVLGRRRARRPARPRRRGAGRGCAAEAGLHPRRLAGLGLRTTSSGCCRARSPMRAGSRPGSRRASSRS